MGCLLQAWKPLVDTLKHRHINWTGNHPATALNRLILQLDSLVSNAAASRKKSRSFLTRASSRFSVAIPRSLRNARAGKRLGLVFLMFSPPAAQQTCADTNVASDLADVDARLAGQLQRFAFELFTQLSSLGTYTLLLAHSEPSWKCPHYRENPPEIMRASCLPTFDFLPSPVYNYPTGVEVQSCSLDCSRVSATICAQARPVPRSSVVVSDAGNVAAYLMLKHASIVERLALVLILLAAAGLCVWGAFFELPYIFHPDEPENIAAIQTMLANQDANPHLFLIPVCCTT